MMVRTTTPFSSILAQRGVLSSCILLQDVFGNSEIGNAITTRTAIRRSGLWITTTAST
jgi:hypothetical protein